MLACTIELVTCHLTLNCCFSYSVSHWETSLWAERQRKTFIFVYSISLARIVVVKVGGIPILCKTDEIGEICVQSMATGSAYWGLQGKTAHNFRVSVGHHT